MISSGTYIDEVGSYGLIVDYTKKRAQICIYLDGNIVSAYLIDNNTEYSYSSNKAKECYAVLVKGIRGCNSKNGMPRPFVLGAATYHEFKKTQIEYQLTLFNNELAAAYIESKKCKIDLYYNNEIRIPSDIPYIRLSKVDTKLRVKDGTELDAVPVRSVDEIALEKEDLTWLNNKKYFIVNDDETAEKIFQFLDTYNGIIAYDVETTGLKINMFGKINSKYAKTLEEYNSTHDSKVRADRLCGIIFCVEEDISYYFPCYSRKYETLYANKESYVRRQIIENTKARYTIGDKRSDNGDMARYIRETEPENFREDVILMERVRNILENGYIETHGGSYEYKTGLLFDIDTNIKDDTMILHQVMYKFNSNVSGKGEPSNLKYLSKKYLGIDQWSLKDFFPMINEKDDGSAHEKSNKALSRIDFSYMDYSGTKVYAPTDGDCTFLLGKKFKADLVTNHAEQQDLYNFEMIVLLAIGYMEFYGHHIDENQINNARIDTKADIAKIESEIRQLIDYASDEEIKLYKNIVEIANIRKDLKTDHDLHNISNDEYISHMTSTDVTLEELCDKIRGVIDGNNEHKLNLNSPPQVADLFYNKLNIPLRDEKVSVSKKALKELMQEKDEDGNDKYPIVHMYSDYKKQVTLLTKFFGNLPGFMYPGGFIFSSYGQISTTTGRMSCSKPNAQQYPKQITNIVTPRESFVMCDSDFSQIEYRTLTAMAGNKQLLNMFSDPDSDYHTLMASLMYGVDYASVTKDMRSAAKSFNFGIPYGMGIASLAILLTGKKDTKSKAEAQEKYDMYFKNQPETKLFFANVKESARVNKYTKTLWNRYRYYQFDDEDRNSWKVAASLRQAGNAVIQGTAADIFKIATARIFSYIRENGLLGKLLIVNMIHDEVLLEIDARYLNVQRILTDVGKCMQYKLDGFPPLYIGAGIGKTWGKAKGGSAEIHPELLEGLTIESEHIPIWKDEVDWDVDVNKIVEYFDGRNNAFRTDKVKQYITNSNNWGKDMHPVIASLLNTQFNQGRKEKQFNSADEFLAENLRHFIEDNNIEGIEPAYFKLNIHTDEDDTDEDGGYEDDEEAVEVISDYDIRSFTLISEDKVYGADVTDLIEQFGTCVIKSQRLCGIDARNIPIKQLDVICDYLGKHACDISDDGALQIVFLKSGNILTKTGVYVNNLDTDELERMYNEYGRASTIGDIESRAVR